MIRLGHILLGKPDLAGEQFTYSMRIELGEIFADTSVKESVRLMRAFRAVYGFNRKILPRWMRLKAYLGILNGMQEWVKKEQALLKWEPDADEVEAGINDLAKKTGAMGTVKRLARDYAQDPDAILKWPYSKVFGILFTDLEERKYEKRLIKKKQARSGKYRRD